MLTFELELIKLTIHQTKRNAMNLYQVIYETYNSSYERITSSLGIFDSYIKASYAKHTFIERHLIGVHHLYKGDKRQTMEDNIKLIALEVNKEEQIKL